MDWNDFNWSFIALPQGVLISFLFRPTKFIQNARTLILTVLAEKVIWKSNNKICRSLNIHFLSGITIIFSLIAFSVLLLSFHVGDVESNPRPNYTREKVPKGSYLQGDERFGDTSGEKCACNSSFSLFWCQIRQAFVWKKADLDHRSAQDDLLYKSLNTYVMLSVDELPWSINNIQTEYLQLETKVATITDGDPFLRNKVPLNNGTLFLLFMGCCTNALITYNHWYTGLTLIAKMNVV